MKSKLSRLVIALILISLPFVFAFASIPVAALGHITGPVNPFAVMLTLAAGFASLLGVSKLNTVLVQIFKLVGLAADGTAAKWTAGLNLLAFGALTYLNVFQPQTALSVLDGYAGQIASIALFVLGFYVQITGSKPAYDQLKASRVPLLSYSHSKPKPASA